MRRTVLVVGAALICLAPVARMELAPITQAATAVNAKQFVETAGVAGMFEIQSSQMAEQKSQNADVKAFAQRMITDHTKAAAELDTVAKSEKFVVPAKLDAKHQKMIDELKSTATQAVELFNKYGKQGDNAALAHLAEKTLPTLQEHYDMVKKISVKQS
jgi:putative membrane protein